MLFRRNARRRFYRSAARADGRMSAVGFGAMTDAENAHGAVLQGEQDTVITEAEPERAGQVAVQRVDVAGTGAGEMENAFKNTHGSGAVEGTNVGLGFVEPLDPIRRHLRSV